MATSILGNISRENLYELVWTTPLRTLASRFQLSGLVLARICDRHDIPRPPVGYWTQKAFGKSPQQSPLPSNPDPAIQDVNLSGNERHPPSTTSDPPKSQESCAPPKDTDPPYDE